MKLLGIDVGTSGTRAVLLDGEGRVVSSATAAHLPLHRFTRVGLSKILMIGGALFVVRFRNV